MSVGYEEARRSICIDRIMVEAKPAEWIIPCYLKGGEGNGMQGRHPNIKKYVPLALFPVSQS